MAIDRITRRRVLAGTGAAAAIGAAGCGRTEPQPGTAAPSRTAQFAAKLLDHMSAATLAPLSYVGERLGIFRAMAGSGPLTVAALAGKTGLNPRYLRAWLESMTAFEYIEYQPATRTFLLPPEHAAVLVDEESPSYLGGALEGLVPLTFVTPKVMEAFRTGKGVAYVEYPAEFFESIARWSAPGFKHQLVQKWIPAMPAVERRLRDGGTAADIGCGQGIASIVLAKAFPRSRFRGFDPHAPSIERARARAKEAGVAGRVTFEAVDGARIPPLGFDLVTSFDVLHDAADPRSIVRSARMALAPGGSYLASEPEVSAKLEENIDSMGRLFYPAALMYCMSVSLGQGGAGIGSDINEDMVRQWGQAAGFHAVRRLPLDDGMFLEMSG